MDTTRYVGKEINKVIWYDIIPSYEGIYTKVCTK